METHRAWTILRAQQEQGLETAITIYKINGHWNYAVDGEKIPDGAENVERTRTS